MSILVPTLISSSTRLGKVMMSEFFLDMLLAFILPIKLHFQLAVAKFMRMKILKQNSITFGLEFEEICTKINEIEQDLAKKHRIHLGTESIYQLAGNVIILCYANSNTKTTQGLASFFKLEKLTIFSISLSPEIILGLLMTLNIATFIRAQVNGLAKGYGSDFHIIGKVTMILCISMASMIRMMSIALYFAPTIGLFNLLHHYKGIYGFMQVIEIYSPQGRILHSDFQNFLAEMVGFQVLNNSSVLNEHHIQTLVDKNISLSFLQRGQFVMGTEGDE